MMKKTTLYEFEDYLNSFPAKQIIYDTRNQENYDAGNPVKFYILFDSISFMHNPNCIFLSSKESSVRIDLVDHVYICYKSSDCRVFHIVCKDICKRSKHKYTITAL